MKNRIINLKNTCQGVLLVIVGFLGFYIGKHEDSDSAVTNTTRGHDFLSRDSATQVPGSSPSGPRSSSGGYAREVQRRPTDLLGELAELSPGIGSYLFFPVVSGPDLELNQNELDILGITSETGEKFRQNLLGILTAVRDQEKEVFEVLEHNDTSVVINIPGFGDQKAALFREKVQDAYMKIMPEALAKETSSKFIESSPELFGTLLGRDRLVQITPPSEGDTLLGGTKPKYRVRSVLLGHGIDHQYYSEKGQDPFLAMAGNEILVEELPGEWSHYFESE